MNHCPNDCYYDDYETWVCDETADPPRYCGEGARCTGGVCVNDPDQDNYFMCNPPGGSNVMTHYWTCEECESYDRKKTNNVDGCGFEWDDDGNPHNDPLQYHVVCPVKVLAHQGNVYCMPYNGCFEDSHCGAGISCVESTHTCEYVENDDLTLPNDDGLYGDRNWKAMYVDMNYGGSVWHNPKNTCEAEYSYLFANSGSEHYPDHAGDVASQTSTDFIDYWYDYFSTDNVTDFEDGNIAIFSEPENTVEWISGQPAEALKMWQTYVYVVPEDDENYYYEKDFQFRHDDAFWFLVFNNCTDGDGVNFNADNCDLNLDDVVGSYCDSDVVHDAVNWGIQFSRGWNVIRVGLTQDGGPYYAKIVDHESKRLAVDDHFLFMNSERALSSDEMYSFVNQRQDVCLGFGGAWFTNTPEIDFENKCCGDDPNDFGFVDPSKQFICMLIEDPDNASSQVPVWYEAIQFSEAPKIIRQQTQTIINDLISNSEEWFICNANGANDLSGANLIPELGSFDYVGDQLNVVSCPELATLVYGYDENGNNFG
ncbi:hypothetical protein JW868_02030, partial [Candidatus Woesearchaeota archaeon]|nr:hypothetical protein [Candidatus Woesearchaeota archaeon]